MKHSPLLLLLLLTLCTLACQPKPKKRNGKLKVTTTTGMIYDAVRHIGQDSVEAQALMGPGVDPHLYKATQGDLAKLQAADLVLYNGLHLEGKMQEVLHKLGRVKPVKAVSEHIPDTLLRDSEAFPGTYDPHIWFDVALWKHAVRAVWQSLVELDPTHADFFNHNAHHYLKQLDSLHLAVKQSIQSLPSPQRVLVTAHDAFGYFGDAYGMEVKGLQGISTLSEPGLKDVAQLVSLLTERQIKAVFIETSVSPQAIEAVVEGCRQKGHPVAMGGSLYSDAMGAFDTPEGTYIGMVSKNVNTIVQALQ